MKYFFSFFSALKRMKLHFVLLFISIIIFSIIFFPFDDLSDWVTSQISKASHNTILLQFTKLKLDLVPAPGLQMNNVYLESPLIAPLTIQNLTISPSISGLIAQKPFGSIDAQGILKGRIQMGVKKGSRTENGDERFRIDLSADKLNLNDLTQLLRIPVLLNGHLSFQSNGNVQLSFVEQNNNIQPLIKDQPDLDFQLTIQDFQLPPANINTDMGPLTLPDFKLSKADIKGRLAAGKLYIESATIGNSADEISGSIKGSLDLQIKSNNNIHPEMGGYQFDVNLVIKKTFQDKAALFLTFIEPYKIESPSGTQYKFKVASSNPFLPPQITALR